jgi:hypothetical protein
MRLLGPFLGLPSIVQRVGVSPGLKTSLIGGKRCSAWDGCCIVNGAIVVVCYGERGLAVVPRSDINCFA